MNSKNYESQPSSPDFKELKGFKLQMTKLRSSL